jgi:flagellar protein FliO/FliZ
MWLAQVVATEPMPWPPQGGGLWRSVVALLVVFGLLALFVWLMRRGTFGLPAAKRRPADVRIESAFSLGERRSLAIVNVEGRRLLLGLSSMQVTLLTELGPAAEGFARTLDAEVSKARGGQP